MAVFEQGHRNGRGFARIVRIEVPGKGRETLRPNLPEQRVIGEQQRRHPLRRSVNLLQAVENMRAFIITAKGHIGLACRAFHQRQGEAGIVVIERQRRHRMGGIAHHHMRADAAGQRNRPQQFLAQANDMGVRNRHELLLIMETGREALHQGRCAVPFAGRFPLDHAFIEQGLHDPAGGGVGDFGGFADFHHRNRMTAIDRLQNRKAAADRANGNALFHFAPWSIIRLVINLTA